MGRCPYRFRRSGHPLRCSAIPRTGGRAIALTFEQFTYGSANNLPRDEARQLCEEFHVAGSGVPIFQAVAANLNPRLDCASRRLASGKDTVDAIAHQCGFADASHFSRRFRAHFGLPPREWRALWQQLPDGDTH